MAFSINESVNIQVLRNSFSLPQNEIVHVNCSYDRCRNYLPKPILQFVTTDWISGTATPNATVELYHNGEVYGRSLVDMNGNWKIYFSTVSETYNMIKSLKVAQSLVGYVTSEFSSPYHTTFWLGKTDDNWSNPTNWSNGVPNDTLNALILNNKQLLFPRKSNVTSNITRGVYIAANAKIDFVQQDTLKVLGNWYNAGNPSVGDSGTISFEGVADQLLMDTTWFNNLAMDKPNNTKVIFLHPQTIKQRSILKKGYVFTQEHTLKIRQPNLVTSSASSFIIGTINAQMVEGNLTIPLGMSHKGFVYTPLLITPYQLKGTNELSIRVDSIVESNLQSDERLEIGQIPNYNNLHQQMVFSLTADQQPQSGSFSLALPTSNLQGLSDNLFTVVNRPTGSSDYADWNIPSLSTQPEINRPGRTVASGLAIRTGLNTFGQYAIASATVVTSVTSHNTDSKFKIEINPSTQTIDVYVHTPEILTLELFDLSGKQVKASTTQSMSTADLKPGVYLLRYATHSFVKTQRVWIGNKD